MFLTIMFLQSEPRLALLIAVLIFFITIFLVIKKWIGFSVALLLLIFSLAAGLVIKNQQFFETYASEYHHQFHNQENEAFKKQILQALEDIKKEVNIEKENCQQVMKQVQAIFEQMDAEKQKLQLFIEETKEKFKKEPAQQTVNEELHIPQDIY
ncbi:Uncharacterized protein PRO82_000830 [Candidatus Protochlamydia amoebophila]|uniref:hypothetical protein n=1 Tax=Candidatus Protochlamydia amoebophila TaxID=362787 RepID=UPI001BCA2415|nr:hypothetical protein [Candidatus Protochlamydia amoebophila]MBS4163527.1 Uncharacterized protein [Candidatus Protochlamydia amoebophila]